MNTIAAMLNFFALDDASQQAYLRPIPGTPVLVSAPEVEIVTQKPRLIMALIFRSKPYPADWLDNLTAEQATTLAELEAVVATMLELGIWQLFSLDPQEQETAKEYLPTWGALRRLARHCLQELRWQVAAPELSFEFFLRKYTVVLVKWSAEMVR